MAEFKWTKPRERAAKLLAEDALTDEQIAAQVGVTPRQLWYWKATPAFADRVSGIVAAYADAIKDEGIANVKNRVAALNRDFDATETIIAERAIAAEVQDAPGGKTGRIVRTLKMLGSGEFGREIEEFAYDTALEQSRLAILKQAAQELGQWTEKQEVTGKGGKPIAIATATFDWSEYQRLYGSLTGIPAAGGDAVADDGDRESVDPANP